ncbi:MAG: hypothetical protein HQ518_24505 [Rhodopirellula sp.]|nr:hypothetical protein [Rhodopirellula sp.]
MNDDRISVIEAAQAVGYGKQGVFKLLNRLGIETFKERSADHNGQAIAYISLDYFRLLQSDVASRQGATTDDLELDGDSLGLDYGVFYLIKLEPTHDPGRFKVGFATNINERLRTHRCSAPFSQVAKTWPCKRLWERTAIDCVTATCEQLHTEVFRTDDLVGVITTCDNFFAIMPSLVDAEDSTGDSAK